MSSPDLMRPAAPRSAGVIHDIGYRNYDGPRGGRRQILLALYLHSLRGVFGLGRAARTKILPMGLAAFMLMPAAILVAVMFVTGAQQQLIEYTMYATVVQAVPAIFLAAQAPQTVSRDLRFHSLPLYFSRQLTHRDYVAAKFAGMASAMFILLAAPLTVMYVGGLLAKLPLGRETGDYLGALAMVALLALLCAGVGLLLAALTPRRGFGVAAIITLFAGSYAVATAVQGITYELGDEKLAGWAGLFSPMTLWDGVQVALLGVESSTPSAGPPGTAGKVVFVLVLLGLIAGSYALLSLRYRKVSNS